LGRGSIVGSCQFLKVKKIRQVKRKRGWVVRDTDKAKTRTVTP